MTDGQQDDGQTDRLLSWIQFADWSDSSYIILQSLLPCWYQVIGNSHNSHLAYLGASCYLLYVISFLTFIYYRYSRVGTEPIQLWFFHLRYYFTSQHFYSYLLVSLNTLIINSNSPIMLGVSLRKDFKAPPLAIIQPRKRPGLNALLPSPCSFHLPAHCRNLNLCPLVCFLCVLVSKIIYVCVYSQQDPLLCTY